MVYELHKLYPEAPIYTSYCTDEWRQKLDGKVVTGYLQHWPFNKLRKILQIPRIQWFEGIDFSGYDLVISSSGNGEAMGVKAGFKFHDGQTHVCYCHTPTHFYWRHYDTYMANFGLGVFNPLARLGLRLLINPLRRWDLQASQRPDIMIANSTHIQSDIKKYYGRDSVVIHPPIDVGRFSKLITTDPSHKRRGFVTVGRQVPQKKTDLIVRACTELNQPLTVIGNGPEHDNLRALAGPTITFIADASDQDVAEAVANAKAFLFAAYDDFGITPVEALAAGTPVIAYQAGGALDYVQPGVTGAFFAEQTTESLAAALKRFDPKYYDSRVILQSAMAFSTREFDRKMKSLLDSVAEDI